LRLRGETCFAENDQLLMHMLVREPLFSAMCVKRDEVQRRIVSLKHTLQPWRSIGHAINYGDARRGGHRI
jgi:hypothetical protein